MKKVYYWANLSEPTDGKREWVKHKKIQATKPMEYLCLDIKYLWIHGEKRFYYLLTILNVYS
jgi:putative transposase